MGVEVSIDPPVCPIAANGGVSKHKIINHTDLYVAYKVRCSDNSHYSVNKVYGIIRVAERDELIITRRPGKPQADKLVIEYANIDHTKTDPKEPFATGKAVGYFTGETVVKLSAAE